MTEPTVRTADGVWKPIRLKEDWLRDAFQSDTPGSVIEVAFPGPELTIPVLQHAWSGVIEVQIDGGPALRADLYSPFPLVTLWQVVDLTAGPHTLTVRLAAEANPAARGRGVVIGRPTTAAPAPLRPGGSTRLCAAAEGQFFVLDADIGVSLAIRTTGVWAAEDVALFRLLVRPGDVVFDVGANIGHHTVVYSHLTGPTGRVYAFEPQRWVFNVLCANLMANECRNAHPFRLALGDQPGRLRFGARDDAAATNVGAAALSKLYQDGRGEEVAIQTLDGFVAAEAVPRVDFLKLDVQTFELFVLQGGRETLRRFRPRLFVEIAPFWMSNLNGYDHREIYRLLQDAGYDLLDKSLSPIDTGRPDEPDPAVEWDVIAVPREVPLARSA